MSSGTDRDLIEPFCDSAWFFLDNGGNAGCPAFDALVPLFGSFGFHMFATGWAHRVFCFHQ
jgi:hypothetical protein